MAFDISGESASGSLGDRVDPISEPTSAEGSGEAQQTQADTITFAIELPEGQTLDATATGSAQITVEESGPDALHVEAAAIREDDVGQAWVQLIDGSRVDVELGLCDAGHCVVESASLSAGQDIALPTAFDDEPVADGR